MSYVDTIAVHAGEPAIDRKDSPVTPDITVGSASGYPDLKTLDTAMAEHRGYGRWGTENHRQLEAAVASLESNGLQTRLDALAGGSGRGASAVALMSERNSGGPRWGADVVIYSATKNLSGHADVIGGVIVGKPTWIDAARAFAHTFGPTLGPFDAWLTLRGIRTLAIRMERHTENALRLAQSLERHRAVSHVNYPALETSPFCARARRLLPAGAGALLSFELAGGTRALESMIQRLRLARLMPSLGNVATTISHPAATSHRGLDAAERARARISDALVRCSAGIEHCDDLVADFEPALA